jgi:hypothetical protein
MSHTAGPRRLALPDLDPTRFPSVQRPQALFAFGHMKRGAALRNGFGQQQGAVVELERSERILTAEFRGGVLPVQPSLDLEIY